MVAATPHSNGTATYNQNKTSSSGEVVLLFGSLIVFLSMLVGRINPVQFIEIVVFHVVFLVHRPDE